MFCQGCQNTISNRFECTSCKKLFCSDACLVTHIVNHKNDYFNFFNFEKVKKGSQNVMLGRGAFGEVYLAKNKLDGKYFAIKKIEKLKLQNIGIKYECIYKEISTHLKLIHKNIARLYSYYEDDSSFYLIIEYVEKGTLFNVIQKSRGLSEDKAYQNFIQVASALRFLHENNLMHRDLKPENCLLDSDDNIKLCDFGWTVETSKPRETFCGTYEYMAPEIIKELPYNHLIDAWSLGILLYEMTHSYSPFRVICYFNSRLRVKVTTAASKYLRIS
jgi:serine/threonine protein kinase